MTESDVMLAAASQAIILAFNVRPVGTRAPSRNAKAWRSAATR